VSLNLAPQIVKKSQSGGGVAVKIEHAVYESGKMFGRHFDEKDELFSHITRQSIDVLKVWLHMILWTSKLILAMSRRPSRLMFPMRSGS
jgi:translation initiation factor 5B